MFVCVCMCVCACVCVSECVCVCVCVHVRDSHGRTLTNLFFCALMSFLALAYLKASVLSMSSRWGDRQEVRTGHPQFE